MILGIVVLIALGKLAHGWEVYHSCGLGWYLVLDKDIVVRTIICCCLIIRGSYAICHYLPFSWPSIAIVPTENSCHGIIFYQLLLMLS